MSSPMRLVEPRVPAVLDPGFRPAVLANRRFRSDVVSSGRAVRLVLALERSEGARTRFETSVFAADHPRAGENLAYAERLFKFLLWQCGGWKAWVGGPAAIADHLRQMYSPGGARAFDRAFMQEDVYGHPFAIVHCEPDAVPPARRRGAPAGPPPRRMPGRVRPRRIGPQGVGGHRRRGRLLGGSRVDAGLAERSRRTTTARS